MGRKKKAEEAGVDLPEQPDLEVLAEQLARAYEEAGIELPGGSDAPPDHVPELPGDATRSSTEPANELDSLPPADDPTVEELLELVVDLGDGAAAEAAPGQRHAPQPAAPPSSQATSASSMGQAQGADDDEVEGSADAEDAGEDEELPEEDTDLESTEQELLDDRPPEDEPVELVTIVEALLFVGARPVRPEDVASKLPGTSTEEVQKAIVSLARQYAKQARPYRVVRTAKGYLTRLLPEFAHVHKKPTRKRSVQLSPAALEVLAIIAYRQPISLEEIDKLRSARSGGLLKQLLARRLVEPVPGSENRKGKTRYRTTARFLQVFRLASLGDLPRPDFSAATELHGASKAS